MSKDVFKFLNELKSDIDIAEEIFNDENAINESIDDFLFEETIDELIEEAALTISEDIADDMIIEAVDLSQYRKGGSKEGKLPPHLAKFIDPKTGNFTKDAEARIQKGKKSKASFKDVTPKGYGPKESVELDEKAPKIDPDKYAAHMSRNKKAVRKTSASQDYIKDVQKRSNKMAREEIEESVEIDEVKGALGMESAAKALEKYAKAFGGMDEKDFMTAARLLRKGLDMKLKKFVNDMDTEPREKVITTMAKTLGKKPVEKMFSVRLREINETISDQKMEMLRKAYSSMPERLSIDQINKLKSVLSKFSKSELEQVKKAKINWLSSMAITLKASTQY